METPLKDIEKLERLTKRERLGELLVRAKVLPLELLVALMNEHKFPIHGPFGEFLIEKSYLTRQKLLEFLNLQKIQDRVIDSCLEELGLMTNEKKWENLTRYDKLGEILIRQGKLSLNDLICGMEEQNSSPEKLLGDIFLEKEYVTEDELQTAVRTQEKQSETLVEIINEISNISQLPIRVRINQMNTLWGGF